MSLPGVTKRFSWQNLRQELLLSFLTIALVLALIEAGLRQIVPRPTRWLEPQVFAQNSPTLKWELRPYQRSFTIDAPVISNSLGFRDDEFSIQKPQNTFRILCLGDSITFGFGVRFEETFVQRLERMLNQEFQHLHFEVINMGVAGYNTRQELISLAEKGVHYEPDLVIVGFYWNDILGNYQPLPWEPGFVPESPAVDETGHVKWTERHRIPKWLRDNLRDWRALYITVQGFKILIERLRQSDHPYHIYFRALLNRDEEYLKGSWKYTEKRLREIAQLATEHDFKVIILIFPDGVQMDVKYLDIPYQSEIKKIAIRVGVPYIDLLPIFKKAYDESVRPFLDYDNAHPNKTSHKIAAKELFEFLITNNYIPRPKETM